MTADIIELARQYGRYYNTVRPHASLKYRPPAPEVIIPKQPELTPRPPMN